MNPTPPPPLEPAESGRQRGFARKKRHRSFGVRFWLLLALILGLLYGLWCGGLYLFQDRLLFPNDTTPPPLPLGYQGFTTVTLTRPLDDGQEVTAWYLPVPTASADSPAAAVIYFHGNAELIDYQHDMLKGYHGLGCSVLLPEYRGYGRSGGRPSERAIIDDAVFFHDVLCKRAEVDSSRIVFHGRSLGGAVAAGLASQRRPKALILESTFTSATAFSWRYGVPPALVRHPFHTDQIVSVLECPILVLHGRQDTLIPLEHGRTLAQLARRGRLVEYACGHNDFPGDGNEDAYWLEIEGFLRESGVRNGGAAPASAAPPVSRLP